MNCGDHALRGAVGARNGDVVGRAPRTGQEIALMLQRRLQSGLRLGRNGAVDAAKNATLAHAGAAGRLNDHAAPFQALKYGLAVRAVQGGAFEMNGRH